MKKHVMAAVAALGLGTGAAGFAQTSSVQDSVTIYGIVDTGVEMITHGNAKGNTVTRMPANTAELPSRWGMRGTESLGGGVSTIFTLESGLNVRDGSLGQGGRMFGRQAWVGLQSPYGTLSLGRQYTMNYWAMQGADLLGPDIYGGTGSFDNWVPNARSDNTVAYKGTWNGITAGATYSFGRDVTGNNSPGQGSCAGGSDGVACREWSAMLRYDGAGFGMAASYDEQRGGPSATVNLFDGVAPLALANPNDKDVRMQITGYYDATGSLKFGGGWLGRMVDFADQTSPGIRSNLFYLTSAWSATQNLLIDGGIYRIVNHEQDARGTILVIRTTYSFSKRTAVYWQGGYLFNSRHAAYTLSQGGPGATPGAGMNQLGLMVGLRHFF